MKTTGSSQTHDTLLDITQEALAEAQEDLWRFAWVENHHRKREGYASSKLEPELARLQAWLQRQGRTGPYWVGESLSHVDLITFCYLDELDAFFPETLSRYEPLAAPSQKAPRSEIRGRSRSSWHRWSSTAWQSLQANGSSAHSDRSGMFFRLPGGGAPMLGSDQAALQRPILRFAASFRVPPGLLGCGTRGLEVER